MAAMTRVLSISLLAVTAWFVPQTPAPTESPTVAIHVNAAETVGPMTPMWAWFGYDEPNYTYMKDGKKLLSELAELSPAPVYVRAHNLLTTGDGTPALKWGSTNA
jgi:xylan 1,4-beta-xylosidase